MPSSLTYHIADIYLTELNRAVTSLSDASENEKAQPVPLYLVLHPFLILISRTSNSITYQRIFNEVFDPLFNALRPPMQERPLTKRPRLDSDEGLEALKGNSCLENPEEGKTENGKLRQQLCQKMFDIASGSDVREANRKKIYAFWKVIKAEEAAGRDEKVTD